MKLPRTQGTYGTKRTHGAAIALLALVFTLGVLTFGQERPNGGGGGGGNTVAAGNGITVTTVGKTATVALNSPLSALLTNTLFAGTMKQTNATLGGGEYVATNDGAGNSWQIGSNVASAFYGSARSLTNFPDALQNAYNHAHATPTLTIASGANTAVSYNSTIGFQYANDQSIIGVLTNGPNAGTNTAFYTFFTGTFGTNYSTPPLVTLFQYNGIANSGGLGATFAHLSQMAAVATSTTSGFTFEATAATGSSAMVANQTYGFQILIQPTSP